MLESDKVKPIERAVSLMLTFRRGLTLMKHYDAIHGCFFVMDGKVQA